MISLDFIVSMRYEILHREREPIRTTGSFLNTGKV